MSTCNLSHVLINEASKEFCNGNIITWCSIYSTKWSKYTKYTQNLQHRYSPSYKISVLNQSNNERNSSFDISWPYHLANSCTMPTFSACGLHENRNQRYGHNNDIKYICRVPKRRHYLIFSPQKNECPFTRFCIRQ